MIEALDKLHVGKNIGIARAIDDAAVGEAHYVTGRFASVNYFSVVENAAAMKGGGHPHGDGPDGHGAAFIHADGIFRALRFQPVRGLIDRDDLRRKFRGEREDVVNMIEMAVRDQNYIDAIDRVSHRICGVAVDPRIHQNHFASFEAELICSVTEPCNLYHDVILHAAEKTGKRLWPLMNADKR